MMPRSVLSSTCGLAAMATVPLNKRAQIAPNSFFITYPSMRVWIYSALEPRPSDLLLRRPLVYDPPLAAFLDPVLAFLHSVGEIAAGVILFESGHRDFFLARIEQQRHVG